jgi:hypothetical protein
VRPLSSTARASIFAQETAEVWLFLLTITHPQLDQTLRFVNNLTDIVSRGQTYLGGPFELVLPDEVDEDQPPRVSISIDNVDRTIVEALRSISGAPAITLEIILASSPDTVEAGPFDFTLRDATGDAVAVTGTLAFEDLLSEPYPAGTFSPANFPGLF